MSIRLQGLDGGNPISFFAALSLLCIGPSSWRLRWENGVRRIPILEGVDDIQEVLNVLSEDLETWRRPLRDELTDAEGRTRKPCELISHDLPDAEESEGCKYWERVGFADRLKEWIVCDHPLNLCYWKQSGGKVVLETPQKAPNELKLQWAYDLKPELSHYRAILLSAQGRATEGASGAMEARFWGAYGSELISDNKGNLKPTALHFTSGQQSFLDAVRGWLKNTHNEELTLNAESLRSALLGPWNTKCKDIKSLCWSNAKSGRFHALRAKDPSKDPFETEIGVEWLAFRSLELFPVAPHGRRLETTLFRGQTGSRDKDHLRVMTWPIWEEALSLRAVKSLLHYADLKHLSVPQREALSIVELLCARVDESGQGYGTFGPIQPVI